MKECTGCKEVKALTEFYAYAGKYQAECKPCTLARNRAYAKTHRDVANRAADRYKAANPEKIKAHKLAYRAAHTEEQAAYERRRWLENKDALTDKFTKYRQANRQKFVAYQTKYEATHPHVVKALKSKRRARKMGAEGSFTSKEWLALLDEYNNVCLCCGADGTVVTLAADHVVPLSLGGSNAISNIQPLCTSCNSKKYIASTDYRVVTQLGQAA